MRRETRGSSGKNTKHPGVTLRCSPDVRLSTLVVLAVGVRAADVLSSLMISDMAVEAIEEAGECLKRGDRGSASDPEPEEPEVVVETDCARSRDNWSNVDFASSCVNWGPCALFRREKQRLLEPSKAVESCR